MPENLCKLEEKIGYKFSNEAILKEAMTHGSARNKDKNLPHHERLEFLGDAVLCTVFSEYLFFQELDGTPGGMTEVRKTFISDARQNEIAQEIEIQKYVEMDAHVVKKFRRYGEFIEAIIGAVYCDAGGSEGMGLKNAKEVIFTLWGLENVPLGYPERGNTNSSPEDCVLC